MWRGTISWGRDPGGQAETVCRREGIPDRGKGKGKGRQVGPEGTEKGTGRLRRQEPGLQEAGWSWAQMVGSLE